MDNIIIISDFTLYNAFISMGNSIDPKNFSLDDVNKLSKTYLVIFEFFNSGYFWDKVYMLPYNFEQIESDLIDERENEDKKTTKETLFEDLFTSANFINAKSDNKSDLLFIKQILEIDNYNKQVFVISVNQEDSEILNLDNFANELMLSNPNFKQYVENKYSL